ncbi:Glycosyl transferase family 2 [Devosia enhydra]|uniref:Glycosyl transferase family 2 n=1 Tax=Devosia enhydra TaxID=665118 RepID=A0A1K2I0V4_9HYPH|nr:glycosyltransferase family 2 protein [Devosia enhydra]SFZ85953.1 Glycosyl transferase family 2 [Devosia enhydra]
MTVFCVISVRDEARYLPGFLAHIAPYVDGIVALDDGSTDTTRALLAEEQRVVSILSETRPGPAHAHETSNRHRLLMEAARLGARWVLCADADERFETLFLRRLRKETRWGDRHGRPVRLVRIVNLWNSPDHYRLDGACGPRWTPRLFALPRTLSRRQPGMHQPWYPPELDAAPQAVMDAKLYHLRMIDRADRQARFEKFSSVDPDHIHQAQGYAHLVDETGLRLRRIFPLRGYADPPGRTLPEGEGARSAVGRAFHIDPTPGRKVLPPAPVRSRRARPFRGWSHLHGMDFDAVFAEWRRRKS